MLGLDNTDLSTSVNKLIFNVGLLLYCKVPVIKKNTIEIESNRNVDTYNHLNLSMPWKTPFSNLDNLLCCKFLFLKKHNRAEFTIVDVTMDLKDWR